MKIRYTYPNEKVVTLKAPRSVIAGLDAELDDILCIPGNFQLYPHLRELWYNTVGKRILDKEKEQRQCVNQTDA